jgi:hypothetical protein
VCSAAATSEPGSCRRPCDMHLPTVHPEAEEGACRLHARICPAASRRHTLRRSSEMDPGGGESAWAGDTLEQRSVQRRGAVSSGLSPARPPSPYSDVDPAMHASSCVCLRERARARAAGATRRAVLRAAGALKPDSSRALGGAPVPERAGASARSKRAPCGRRSAAKAVVAFAKDCLGCGAPDSDSPCPVGAATRAEVRIPCCTSP